MIQDDVVNNVKYLAGVLGEFGGMVEFLVDGVEEVLRLEERQIRRNNFMAMYYSNFDFLFHGRQVQGQAAKTALYNALPKLVPES